MLGQTVTVRGICLGEGMPKICIPLTGKTKQEILLEAQKARKAGADVTEWRVDWFEGSRDASRVEDVLRELRGELGEIPLLFTFRTAREGGEREPESGEYRRLCEGVLALRLADMLDVELSAGEETVKALLDAAHRKQVPVILSCHHFDRTPGREEMADTLRRMRKAGADLAKLAVMPETARDVLELLAATEEVGEEEGCPLITMSMSGLGMASRLCGELTGSVLTFGTAGKSSAPGQPDAGELRNVLELLHRDMPKC